MSDRSALLNEILTNPEDDTARLVLADFLRECDDVAEQARGRFLWAGVVASRFRSDELIDDPEYYLAHGEIAAVCSAGHPKHWLAEVGPAERQENATWGWDCTYDRVTVRVGGVAGTFARGLLAEIDLSLDGWHRIAERVLAASPLEQVSVSDVPGLRFRIEHLPGAWRVTSHLKLQPRRIALTTTGPIPSSVSPSPFLQETNAEWTVEETFQTRSEMTAVIVKTTQTHVQELLEEVEHSRWPRNRMRR